jgi:hypothetical protein
MNLRLLNPDRAFRNGLGRGCRCRHRGGGASTGMQLFAAALEAVAVVGTIATLHPGQPRPGIRGDNRCRDDHVP